MQNRDEFQHFAKQKKQNTKQYILYEQQNYPTETEFRKVVAGNGVGTGREKNIRYNGKVHKGTLKAHDCSISLETLQQCTSFFIWQGTIFERDWLHMSHYMPLFNYIPKTCVTYFISFYLNKNHKYVNKGVKILLKTMQSYLFVH